MGSLTRRSLRAYSDFKFAATSGAQPPHEVAALVPVFNAPMVVHPASIAEQSAPLVTLLQEQICAEDGSAATPSPVGFLPPSSAGTMSSSGFAGSAKPFSIICSHV